MYFKHLFFSHSLVIVALIDRMGDAKDKVRDEAQNLILKLMDQVALPMVGLHFKILLVNDEILVGQMVIIASQSSGEMKDEILSKELLLTV